jgi:hypothetical protein
VRSSGRKLGCAVVCAGESSGVLMCAGCAHSCLSLSRSNAFRVENSVLTLFSTRADYTVAHKALR